MTSSLVGSEMCIRDSRRHLPRGRRVGDDEQEEGRDATMARARSERHAVSYTHLTLPTICSV
eukprot:567682-Prorocentrum_lima.AAC.1